jgi:hypothetical protein
MLTEVYERLMDKGVAVDDSIPEERLLSTEDLEVRHDLYLLKSHTELVLSMAGALNALGGSAPEPSPQLHSDAGQDHEHETALPRRCAGPSLLDHERL